MEDSHKNRKGNDSKITVMILIEFFGCTDETVLPEKREEQQHKIRDSITW